MYTENIDTQNKWLAYKQFNSQNHEYEFPKWDLNTNNLNSEKHKTLNFKDQNIFFLVITLKSEYFFPKTVPDFA